MKLVKYIVPPLALAFCVGLAWFIYNDSLEYAQQEVPKEPASPIAVHVTRIQKQTVQEQIGLVGTLAPTAAVEIRARTDGYITDVPFDVGDYVEEGQLVVGLDNEEAREMVKRAEAALKVARAQRKSKESRKAFAQQEIERLTSLSGSGVATQQQRDQAQADFAIATAEVDLEQARVEEAESDLHRAKLALRQTSLTAPMDGYVAERYVDVGDLAKPDVPLFQIVRLKSVRTIVNVVERDYEKVQIDQPAYITVDAFPGKSFTGKVVRKAPVLDNDTRTAAVHIEIPNPEIRLKPGMHARVELIFRKQSDVDVVPIASLLEQGRKQAIFVVDGDPPQVELHEVKTGINDGSVVEILAGIDPEDRVVTLGSRMIEHGQLVTPIEVPWPERLNASEEHALSQLNHPLTSE